MKIHPPVRKIRHIIFLKDVLILAVTCFGGPQVHLLLFLERLVKKRRYLSEAELLELQALCQILPGPTSTQTITALGFKIGGSRLAYLTVLVWSLPAVIVMTLTALGIFYLQEKQISLSFMRFVQPMAIGFLAFGGYTIGKKVILDHLHWFILMASALTAYFFPSPYMTPIVIVLGGVVTALRFQRFDRVDKTPIKIKWDNFFLWLVVLVIWLF
ncbi:MAG: chromate transporter [Spirosomataceae bacterium]